MAARVQYRGQSADNYRPPAQNHYGAPGPRGTNVGAPRPQQPRNTGGQQQGINVKLYRVEQYQAMWNHWSGIRNQKIIRDYQELMATPKGAQLQQNLQEFWEQKTKANGGKEVSLDREDFFEWVGRYEMDRPRRNAEGGYDSSDDEDGYSTGEYTDSEEARGCCG